MPNAYPLEVTDFTVDCSLVYRIAQVQAIMNQKMGYPFYGFLLIRLVVNHILVWLIGKLLGLGEKYNSHFSQEGNDFPLSGKQVVVTEKDCSCFSKSFRV